ncbi:MAG: RNA recognition motif domain-containing protein [Chromatiales bacterium]
MATSIYVGNLAQSTTNQDIRALFEQFGKVESVNILIDGRTGASGGFGFVKMNDASAKAAIAALDMTLLAGRNLAVHEAAPRRVSDAFGRGAWPH